MATEEPIVFKRKAKRGSRRQRQDSDDEEDSSSVSSLLRSDQEEEKTIHEKITILKELRKLRERPHGVSAVTLALGKKAQLDEEVAGMLDPFKTKQGGMIDMEKLKAVRDREVDDAYETGIGIGTQFSAETNTRDEDAEMLKYIEEQLNEKKRLASLARKGSESDEIKKFLSPEEMALQSLPEYLRKSGSSKSEEMLSNQMLSGIPEVDLGIEVKIRNIEATEEAKQKIIREKKIILYTRKRPFKHHVLFIKLT